MIFKFFLLKILDLTSILYAGGLFQTEIARAVCLLLGVVVCIAFIKAACLCVRMGWQQVRVHSERKCFQLWNVLNLVTN